MGCMNVGATCRGGGNILKEKNKNQGSVHEQQVLSYGVRYGFPGLLGCITVAATCGDRKNILKEKTRNT